jgi:3-hydroxybutyryl-CoA dehydrogenase
MAFGDAVFVIDAASEIDEVKREIFKALCPILKPDALLATNSSSI